MATGLQITDLRFCYSGDSLGMVLDGVSIDAPRGSVTTLVGPSGCGKSTLLSLVAGLLEPAAGRIAWVEDGVETTIPSMGFAFQDPLLLPWATVRANAALGHLLRCREEPAKDELLSMLGRYGLGQYIDGHPAQLSGGMQQRVSLARALLSGAELLLLDEPLSNSDLGLRKVLRNDIRGAAMRGAVVLLVTHDLGDAIQIGDSIVVLGPRPCRVREILPIPVPPERRLDGAKDPALNHLWNRLLEATLVEERRS